MRLNDWLQLRTFHHQQFSDLHLLYQKKRDLQVSISLCLPTLNEEETIGQIIKILKKELYDRVPLLDEILVIDSGSTDRTVEIARKHGAMVYYANDVLREYGTVRGKGENLWKSVYLAKGDIIIWLDTDIQNMHPRFVYGLIGPLLFQKEIGFVKGFYRRPIKIGKKLQPVGGGRVTEILVKPFFNLLYPQLSVFQQPLSGEYAGRREILERIPFFTGYGVETGLLIDIEDRFGLHRMAQVNLEVRIHRNQDLQALRKMATGILRVLFTRAEQHGKLVLMEALKPQLMNLIQSDQHQFELMVQDLQEFERPPMILLEPYQQLRGLDEEDLVIIEEIQKKRRYPFTTFSQFLDPRLVILDGEARNKDDVLSEISQHLASIGIVSNRAQLLHEFYRRENSLTTGIGSGIAIPHAIFPEVKNMKILIYRSRAGVDFHSLDGQLVHLIFAVIAPVTRRRQYLEILASLSNILKDQRFRELLMRAASRQEIIQILRKAEVVKRIAHELQLVES
ncbi:MAG: glucosyl-3-phosphoglycerate synthase [Calditrichaeota bacterium]|nr:glucosyl-3-phosphoglycerate synthase [Calditrichota bacterium]